ncbi:class I adenylate-forming enzyme family protein [Nocardia sp. NPDC056100]|uniref:class I adenylate-forming enzyme family protein n=1 Tax=Nocardia sp. NPDC056100 TaxID=3345712 RepID=UPI0035DBB860
MTPAIVRIPLARNPFDHSAVVRDAHDVARYTGLPATLAQVLRAHVESHPDTEAIVEVGGERLTYAQLWDRAARVAGGLYENGMRYGDRVAIRYPAGVKWVLAFWGTVLAGGIAVPVNTRSTEPEVRYVLEDADVTVDLAADSALPDGIAYLAPARSGGEIAALFYTSGTTGHPKGVPTTHEAFITNAENMVRCSGIPRDEGAALRTLISVPLFHVTACNSQLVLAAYAGGTAVILPVLDLSTLIDVLVTERISFLITVPAVYSLLLRHPRFGDADLSAVRTVAYGGAPIAPALVRALKAVFPQAYLMNGYGMTETAALITALPDPDAGAHADSVGYAVPSVDLGIVPLDDNPALGELVVRGANVTSGYWNKPEATAAALIEGWLHTGDIVRVDEAGRVHIVDRIKDIINRGGENVSSVEVEAVLLSAPGVADAAVLAVPDAVMGEKVGAVLFGGADAVDIDAVLEHCRKYLADFKIPQFATVHAEQLPRNAGGKLLKNQLRGQVRWGEPLR